MLRRKCVAEAYNAQREKSIHGPALAAALAITLAIGRYASS